MTMYTNLVSNALGTAIRAALPVLDKLSNDQLLALVPPIPVPRADGWSTLREVVKEDTVILNFLRHISSRTKSEAELRERIRRYIVNPIVLGGTARARARKELGIHGLSSISITPTVICNLHCDLCYNLTEIHHDPKEVLAREVMDKVMTEGKEIGAYRFTFIGGEPLIRWRDIHWLAEKHADTMVTIITNGLLLTDEVADAFAKLGNVEMSISIDGFAATHDKSRGEGTFDKVMRAMERYRDAGGMLIFSPTVTSANYREIFSDAFIDLMAEKGCYMGYYHHYDMIGGQDRKHLLLDMDQLRWIDKQINTLVATKPISISDQVLSRLLVGGCPAAKDFIHVNHRGEVESCCMVPFAADNIKDVSLADAMRSRFFQRINKIEADAGGVKRCLVGENTKEIEAAVAAGEAFGTTKTSPEVLLAQANEDGRLHPTCFSASITEAAESGEKRRRVRLPLFS
ncbi:MAG TPA: radical SAM/SPASM domain-containing protein [Kofleriaceae bacterium]|nr:radical SAM/SPASM domain-containing protein [Kofleriaceae bacterium]